MARNSTVDETESLHNFGSRQEAPRLSLSGLLHDIRYARVSISVILLVILLASGALIMLLNYLFVR
jgi:hypothetical protein